MPISAFYCGYSIILFSLLGIFLMGFGLFVARKVHNRNARPEVQLSLKQPRTLMIASSLCFIAMILCDWGRRNYEDQAEKNKQVVACQTLEVREDYRLYFQGLRSGTRILKLEEHTSSGYRELWDAFGDVEFTIVDDTLLVGKETWRDEQWFIVDLRTDRDKEPYLFEQYYDTKEEYIAALASVGLDGEPILHQVSTYCDTHDCQPCSP